MELMRTYRCEVSTTNALRTTCRDSRSIYYACKNGILHVVTDDPKKISQKFGPAIISITDIGVGYFIQEMPDDGG